jgi:hypothetical protein
VRKVEKVILMRPGSTTHHYDSEQRCLELKQAPSAPAGTVVFHAPPNSDYAPPGYYMLFLVSQAGSVSVATWVQVLP